MVRRALAGVIILGMAQGACREGICPTIACQPQVSLTYRQPIAAPYHVVVSVHGVTFEADCPMELPSRTIGITSCGANGLVVTGVDLGHASNDTVDLTISIDSSEPLAVKAILGGISNTRDCDLVCYRHNGTVPN